MHFKWGYDKWLGSLQNGEEEAGDEPWPGERFTVVCILVLKISLGHKVLKGHTAFPWNPHDRRETFVIKQL